MPLFKQRVTLDVTYEADSQDEPSTWRWAALLGLAPEESATVASSEPTELVSMDDRGNPDCKKEQP